MGYGLGARMRIRMGKSVPLSLLLALSTATPGNASTPTEQPPDDSATRQLRVEMLRQVAAFDTESLRSDGVMATTGGERGQRVRVDLRTGSAQAASPRCRENPSGDPLCYSTDRVGHSYTRLPPNWRTAAALRLMGQPRATHKQGFTHEFSEQSGLAAPFAWPSIEAVSGPLMRISDLRRSESADGTLTYGMQIHSCDVCAPESALLSIGSDRLVWRGGGFRVVIERGPQRIGFPPLDRVVPGRIFDSASDAVAARALARSTARRMSAAAQAEIDQRPDNPVGVIRAMVQAPSNMFGVRHRTVPRGAVLIARNRWVSVAWAVTWDSRTESVKVTRRTLPPLASGPPPTRPAAAPVRTQTDPASRALAGEAGARALSAAVWAVAQPGLRVEFRFRDESGGFAGRVLSTTLMDFTTGVVATPAPSGGIERIRHPGWTECRRIGGDQGPGPATRRALSLAGTPDADFTCGPGGDTDLAWAGLYTPAGLSLDWSVLWSASRIQLLAPDPGSDSGSVVYRYLTRWPGQPDKERTTTLAFSGPALVSSSKADSSQGFELRYQYGPQGLTFPRGDARISTRTLAAARLTLRAPRLVHRTARAVVRRAESSLAGNPRSDPIAVIRKAARETVWHFEHVRSQPRRGGVLLHVTTRFGRSGRTVTWNNRRTVVQTHVVGTPRSRSATDRFRTPGPRP